MLTSRNDFNEGEQEEKENIWCKEKKTGKKHFTQTLANVDIFDFSVSV